MSQLFLWDESVHPSNGPGNNTEQDPGASDKKENRAALRCKSSADGMQKHINAKHQSANNMLALPPTRKRFSDADSLRNQAIRLERIQATLRQLAEMHITATITPGLEGITTKSAIESALVTSAADSEIHLLYNSVARGERSEERVLRLTNEAATMKIPGYFPTPKPLAERLAEMSCIEPGNTILEPSAGTGNLIDSVLGNHPNIRISYCEFNCFLLDILRSKYAGRSEIRFLGRDCLDIDTNRPEKRFDRIIMNPPFERGQDADHVLHAWFSLLAPKGILTAIVSTGVFSRSDKKSKSFREFLKDAKALVYDLPAESFKTSGTGIETKIVQVRACA